MKKRKIRVYMQYPWIRPDSSYYKNIVEYPADLVEYVNYKKQKKVEVIGSSKKFEIIRIIKNIIRKFLEILRIPNLTYTVHAEKADLIHCAHCLSLNRKPWVVDTEVYHRVAATGKIAYSKLGKWIIKKMLESPYCKKIICWTEDCKKTFEEAFPGNKKILDKIEILHFALPLPKIKKIKHKGLRILFVARWFDAKGGRQTLEVFDRLSKKYPQLEFWFICPTPEKFKKKYGKNPKIKIMDLVPQEKLFREIYPACDIFFYPGFGDSYGFAVPEAMSFGLPIVTTNTFAKREIVGKAGFLVELPKDWKGYKDMNEKLLNDLMEKTEILIKNKELRKKMGEKGRKRVQNGLFSIKRRNEKLRRIYEEALKDIG